MFTPRLLPTLATFAAVDSVNAPTVFAVALVDGEAGRQNCTPRPDEATAERFPVKLPPLIPPAGAMSFGGGRRWSGSDGRLTTTLRTTIPTDSLLAHYAAQLAAAGWTSEGRPANADGVGAQRFTFRQGPDVWAGALIVMAVGDRREVVVQVSKLE